MGPDDGGIYHDPHQWGPGMHHHGPPVWMDGPHAGWSLLPALLPLLLVLWIIYRWYLLDTLAEATETLSEAEVARAKAQLKVSLLTALESSSARAEQIARQHMAFGRVVDLSEILARVDAITVEDVRRAGAAMLATPPTVAAIGPVKHVYSSADVVARLGGRSL